MIKAEGRKTGLGREKLTSPRRRRLIGMSVCPSPKGDGIVLSPFSVNGGVRIPKYNLHRKSVLELRARNLAITVIMREDNN